MADGLGRDFVFEDISSASEEMKARTRKTSGKRKKGAAICLDKIVKAIAFIVALFVLLIFAAGALILYKMDKSFAMIALCILIAGIALALIFLFLIYAIGHMITQNNEILKRL